MKRSLAFVFAIAFLAATAMRAGAILPQTPTSPPAPVDPRERWNKEFGSGAPSLNNLAPNALLSSVVKGRKPGAALDLGIGQGRNALYLAENGWDVTGVDISDVAVGQARENAAKKRLALKAVIANLDAYDFGENQWDLITSFYMHSWHRNSKTDVPARILRALKPGGVVVMEAFQRPPNINGFVVSELATLFRDFTILRNEESAATPDWGPEGAPLVRFVAEKRGTTAVALPPAAAARYFGTWKYNVAKSNLGGYQLTYTDVGAGEIEQSGQDGRSYRFRIDGKQYPDANGRTATWTQPDASTWEARTYVKGELSFMHRFELSKAGDELRTIQKGPRPGAPDITLTWRRAGAGSGLFGTWRRGAIEPPPFELVVEAVGENGIRFAVADVFEVRAQFDGKPYPMTGPTAVPGSTASFERVDERSFRTRQMDGGRFEATLTVSEDGQTLTETGYEGQVNRTWVFDRVAGK